MGGFQRRFNAERQRRKDVEKGKFAIPSSGSFAPLRLCVELASQLLFELSQHLFAEVSRGDRTLPHELHVKSLGRELFP